MSTHNIQFHDKRRKIPEIFVFLSYRKNFVGTQNKFELGIVNKPVVFELLGFNCYSLKRSAVELLRVFKPRFKTTK